MQASQSLSCEENFIDKISLAKLLKPLFFILE